MAEKTDSAVESSAAVDLGKERGQSGAQTSHGAVVEGEQRISELGEIRTTGEAVRVFGMAVGDEMKLRAGKFSPDGRPTYGTGLLIRVPSAKSASGFRTDRNSYLHVIEGTEGLALDEGIWRAAGVMWIKPFATDIGVAYSIVAERVEKVNS